MILVYGYSFTKKELFYTFSLNVILYDESS